MAVRPGSEMGARVIQGKLPSRPGIQAEVAGILIRGAARRCSTAAVLLLRGACCRVMETLDPALGGRRQVQPDSPACLAHAGTRTSRLVSPREDAPSGTPGHVW